jgi:uncharacterized DUF497 family protein
MDHCAVRIFCVFSRPVPPTQGDAFPAVSKIGNQSDCVGPRVFGGLPLAEQQCSTINDPGEGLNHKPPKFPSSDPSSRNRSVTYTQIVHTIKIVEITYDPAKNARNIQERSLSFDRAIDFDFHTALYRVDNRREYGETRIRALGILDGRLHALVFVEQATGIRVISFQKATRREIKRYESSKPSSDV